MFTGLKEELSILASGKTGTGTTSGTQVAGHRGQTLQGAAIIMLLVQLMFPTQLNTCLEERRVVSTFGDLGSLVDRWGVPSKLVEGRTEGEDGVMVQQILIGQKVDTDVGVICLREKDIFANLFLFFLGGGPSLKVEKLFLRSRKERVESQIYPNFGPTFKFFSVLTCSEYYF